MSTKDIAEKHLFNHAEIFADIINVLLFHGKQVVNKDDLKDSKARTQLKIDGGLHEQERDVVKYWEKYGVKIALLGLENQTYVDDDMPLRVLSYDGATYKEQVNQHCGAKRVANKEPVYPCITLVLYFGTTHWDGHKNLLSYFDSVSEDLQPFLNDYHINLFELAFLDDEARSLFTSDFRYIVDYLHQVRVSKSYKAPEGDVQYADELIKFLAAFSHDRVFLDAANHHYEAGRPIAMTDLIGNLMQDERIATTVDLTVNMIRATKTSVDDALNLLGVPKDMRASVAKKVAERLATKQ